MLGVRSRLPSPCEHPTPLRKLQMSDWWFVPYGLAKKNRPDPGRFSALGNLGRAFDLGSPELVLQGMIRKSVQRFSGKIMPDQTAKAR
jgi:hypothetical protein